MRLGVFLDDEPLVWLEGPQKQEEAPPGGRSLWGKVWFTGAEITATREQEGAFRRAVEAEWQVTAREVLRQFERAVHAAWER
jgi:hypothetical protein